MLCRWGPNLETIRTNGVAEAYVLYAPRTRRCESGAAGTGRHVFKVVDNWLRQHIVRLVVKLTTKSVPCEQLGAAAIR